MIVDLDDQIARFDAGTGGRRVINGGDDLDEAVFLTHFNAQAAELAGGGVLQALESFWFEVSGMRVKPFEHATDGTLQQGGIVHWFDIGGTDALQHFGEGTQFIQRQRSCCFLLLRLHGKHTERQNKSGHG